MLNKFDIFVDQIEDPIVKENFQAIRTVINELLIPKSFWTPVYVTAGYISKDLDEINVDTKTPNHLIRIMLPRDPSANMRVRAIDAESYFATKNAIIDGNGKSINGSATLTLTANDDNREFSYNGRQWKSLRL